MRDSFGNRWAGDVEHGAAWFGLGKGLFERGTTPLEAFEQADVLQKVGKFPTYAYTKQQGRIKLDKLVLLREPTEDDPHYREFGIVSDSYQIVDRARVAELLTPLAEQWPITSVGALGQGETVFAVLDAGSFDVQGVDHIKRYVFATDTIDGGSSIQLGESDIRVVCRNTFNLAIRDTQFKIRHNAGAELNVAFYLKLIEDIRKGHDKTAETCNKLAQAHVQPEDLDALIQVAYPEPKLNNLALRASIADGTLVRMGLSDVDTEQLVLKQGRLDETFKRQLDDVHKARMSAADLLTKFNDEHPRLAWTPWAGFQAVVENEDWVRPGKGIRQVKESALFGERAKIKARAYVQAAVLARVN
jgi:hypothetical protein